MVDLNITLPEEFLDEEVRCSYTVSHKMKEVWAVELDLAVQLLNVCQKHGIQIFADSGTLLGAARHGGFIPWDDDMDFAMFRGEYEKLCAIAQDEFQEPYFFQTEYSDPGSLRGHAQLRNSGTTGILKSEIGKASFHQGIFIDIFPMDEVADDEGEFEKQKKEVQKAKKMYRILDTYLYKRSRKNMLKLIWSKIADKFCSRAQWYVKYEHALAKANGHGNRYVSNLCLLMQNDKWLKKREAYEKVAYLNYEGLQFPVPADYDDVLTDLYGDWHEFVKGTSLHKGVCFDTNNSYKMYLDNELSFPNE